MVRIPLASSTYLRSTHTLGGISPELNGEYLPVPHASTVRGSYIPGTHVVVVDDGMEPNSSNQGRESS